MHAALQYAQAGLRPRSNKIVESLKREIDEKPDSRYELLIMLRDVAELDKNEALQIAVMEHIVELRPADIRQRFSLAFKHSEFGSSDLALYHYLKISVSERDAVTWNNLGAAFGDFEMPVKAIDAFRLSERDGETLAMCNLGFKLLGAGFFSEAKKESEKALAIENRHKNVPELLKRLNEVPDEEEERLNKLLDDVKEKAAFYRKLGYGLLKETPSRIAPAWSSPEGPLQAKIDGAIAQISGTYEQPANALGSLLAPPMGGFGAIARRTVKHHVEYSGQLCGNVITGTVKRSREGEPTSLFDSGSEGAKVIMVFNDDQTELSVMENPDNLHPRLYSLTRISSIDASKKAAG